MCENRLAGSGTERAAYCACVVGTTRVPALATTAAWPLANSGASGAKAGCTPKPEAPPAALASATSDSRGKARLGRGLAYSAWRALSVGTSRLLASLPPYRNRQTRAR